MTKTERIAAKLAKGWNIVALHDAIWCVASLTLTQRAVLTKILVYVSLQDGRQVSRPSIRTIAEIGLNKDTVTSTLKRLSGLGLLEIERRHRAEAQSYIMDPLPERLRTMLVSELEGHDVSECKGHDDSAGGASRVPSNRTPCPLKPDTVSEQRGQKEPLEGTLKKEPFPARSDSQGKQSSLPIDAASRKASKEKKTRKKKLPSKSQRKPKLERTPEQNAAHRAVTEAYFDAFKAKANGKPPVFGKKEGVLIWRLLDKLRGDVTEATSRISNAFYSDWGGSTSLMAIANDPDKFAVLNKKAGGWQKQGNNGGYKVSRGDTSWAQGKAKS